MWVFLCVEILLRIILSFIFLDIVWIIEKGGCVYYNECFIWNYVYRNIKKMGKLFKFKCWFMIVSYNFEFLLCIINFLKKIINNWKILWLGVLVLKFCLSVDIVYLDWSVCSVMYCIYVLYLDNYNSC